MLHKFNIPPSLILLKLQNYEYISSLSSTQLTYYLYIYVCRYVYDCFEFLFAFVTSVSQYIFDKIIITNSSKSPNPVQTMHFIQISYAGNFDYYASIMLNAFATLLCLKLCWHNRFKSTHSLTRFCMFKFILLATFPIYLCNNLLANCLLSVFISQ